MSFTAETAPRIGAPTVAWEGDFASYVAFGSSWALSPDGKSIAVWLRGERLAKANQYVGVLNWFEELKRLVPAS